MAKKYCPNFVPSMWHRSCEQEIIDPISGKVSGNIPKWLNGALIRNGPGLFKFGNSTISHYFDGMALIHRFEINDGIVTYQCRFVQSDVYKKNKAANRIVVTDFGTASVPDPCETIFHRIASLFHPPKRSLDNTTISIYPFGDEMYAFAETGVMYKIDKDNLETKEKLNCQEKIGIVTHTAHPHVMEDGTVYNLALSFPNKKPVYHIVGFAHQPTTDADSYSMFDKAEIVAGVPARWKFHPSYMHSFGITKNYFIIIEQPMCISIPKRVFRNLLNMPYLEYFQWYNNEMTRFIVLSRQTGEFVESFYSKGFFYFHTINQYEDSNHIVIDICTFKDSSILNCFYINEMENAHSNPNYSDLVSSVAQRFVLPLGEKTGNIEENLIKISNTTAKAYKIKNGKVIVEPELICDVVCEMPTFNYTQYLGKKYQYFYGMCICSANKNPGSLIKVDIDNKTSVIWFEEDSYPSEPVFVSKPDAQSEDDGVILSCLVNSKDEKRVSLLVLEAKTFREIGRVDFDTPSPSPRSLHGWYFPKNA